MSRRSGLRRMIASALLLAASIASEARAGDVPACGYYAWATVTKTVQVPYTRIVTLHDHCGQHYQVEKTAYRAVQVTVRKRVWVED